MLLQSQHRGSRRRAVSLACLALLLLGACGESIESDSAAPLLRVDLHSLGNPELYAQSRLKTVRRWGEFGDREGWSSWNFHGTSTSVVSSQDESYLVIPRKKDVDIEIPVEVELDSVAFLSLRVLLRLEPVQISAELHRRAERVGVATRLVMHDKELQTVCFDFLSPEGTLGEVDRIRLHVPEGEEVVGLVALTLQEAARPERIDRSDPPALGVIPIDGDARRAAWIAESSVWKATFTVPAEERTLGFSYGAVPDPRQERERSELHVTLELPGGGKREEVLRVDRDPSTPCRWHQAYLPLEASPGDEVRATFRLRCEVGSGLAALGQPLLFRRRKQSETVLLVTSDTHRADHLGFLREEGELRTEAIDRLAASGVTFVDVMSAVNNTTPSHVSLFTGLPPRDTGMVYNVSRLADTAPTLAEAFHDAGYATLAAVSAPPVNFEFTGLDQGFDRYSIPSVETVRESGGTVDQMLAWLPDYDGLPLFLWVHVFDAHGPYDPPDEYERMYYPKSADPFDPNAEGARPDLAPYWNEKILDPDYTEGLYKAEITYLDRQLGRLIDVDRIWSGVIAFTADHGETLRYGNDDPFDHRGLSTNTLFIPLVLRAPGLPAGARREDPVQLPDLGRTLLDLSGNSYVAFPGRNMLAEEVRAGEPRYAMEANGWSAAVVTDRWMLVLALCALTEEQDGRDQALHSVRLYDLRADEYCERDVLEGHPDVARKYRELLLGWLSRSSGENWQGKATASEKEITEHLTALGYAAVPNLKAAAWFDADCTCEWCRRFE